jgi:hypothetical protein
LGNGVQNPLGANRRSFVWFEKVFRDTRKKGGFADVAASEEDDAGWLGGRKVGNLLERRVPPRRDELYKS